MAFYLVTGGAGFIGSNIVAALTARGDRVAVSDRLGEGEKWRNLAKHPLEHLFPPEELDAFLAMPPARLDAVIHMGAISATTERNADRLVANNFALSRNLWLWCAAAGVPLVYASSAATYGAGEAGFLDDDSPGYLAGLKPLNGYGWSKLLFDRWAVAQAAAGRATPPRWAGLKFFNVYGPNEHHKEGQASVALHLFNQIRRGEPATLFQSHHPDYPDGGQLRDFVSVEDCAQVVLWLLDEPGRSGLFNVGTGAARSFADLARALFAAVEVEENIRYVPTPEAIRDKYQYFTQAQMGRLRAAGYQRPFASLEDGVGRYVRQFLSQEDPYR